MQSTNSEVYDQTLRDLVSGVLYGINTTVFAYGATGSGKTYTMVGEWWWREGMARGALLVCVCGADGRQLVGRWGKPQAFQARMGRLTRAKRLTSAWDMRSHSSSRSHAHVASPEARPQPCTGARAHSAH